MSALRNGYLRLRFESGGTIILCPHLTGGNATFDVTAPESQVGLRMLAPDYDESQSCVYNNLTPAEGIQLRDALNAWLAAALVSGESS